MVSKQCVLDFVYQRAVEIPPGSIPLVYVHEPVLFHVRTDVCTAIPARPVLGARSIRICPGLPRRKPSEVATGKQTTTLLRNGGTFPAALLDAT